MSGSVERGPESRPALSRLLTGPLDRFAEETWGRRALLSTADELGGTFEDLFSSADVDELLSERALRTPFVRMAREGAVLPAVDYTGSGGFGAEVSDQLDPAKVLARFADGATIVLQGLHRTWPPLVEFTRRLTEELGHPCQVNAYITPASSRGFDPHYDVHDVFVVQIAGEKHWTIHEPVHPNPLRSQPWTDHRAAVAARAAEPPALDETFRPGDVLYLPRGWIHSATALGGTSIHLTIGVAAYTRLDALERLLRAASSSERVRAALPMGADLRDPVALRTMLTELVSDVTAAVDLDDASAALADHFSRRLSDATRPEPVRPLATVEALSSLEPTTRVGLRAGLAARVERAGPAVRISARGTTLSMPVEAAEALEHLVGGGVAEAGSLPGLDESSSLVVTRRLLREAILVVR
ncbi:Cupin superfamily protein [Diaminobutyricimonas aerilata]|uniref:Cupin superfamily protein n=1 Tax=Diaminobutyricimonas aerilata TaxID=1162967 RepID=A0A2M9CGT4_9MICO|nr:cupin domain-containing protein [Diaminobutyricimonas aerilata]PJJ71097.1 Cupin superfamily protein [Diaminobutyricimonas aerilata]